MEELITYSVSYDPAQNQKQSWECRKTGLIKDLCLAEHFKKIKN